MMPLFRRSLRRRDDRGAVLILGALFASVAIVAAALSIDIGALVLSKRSNQRIADLASLDAVRGLTDRSVVERIALESADRNGFSTTPAGTRTCTGGTLTPDTGAEYTWPDGRWMRVEVGKYDPNVDGNFDPVSCPPASILETLFPIDADAVRVTISSPVAFNFMPGGSRETASAVAKLGTATTPPVVPVTTTIAPGPTTTIVTPGSQEGGVRVGSRMASINTTQAQVLNALLSTVNNPLGSPLGDPPGVLSISAVGYQGLATASMSIQEIATQLGITAGTVDQVLAAQFSYSDLISAMILIADRNNQDAVAASLRDIQQFTLPLDYPQRHQTISLGDFTGAAGVTGGASTFNGSSVSEGSLDVLELVRGGAVLADGDHLVDVPLSASTPGLLPTGVTSATAHVQAIEAAQYNYGPIPVPASTAQLRTTLSLTMPIDLGSLGIVNVTIPVNIDGGGATATADRVDCNAAGDAPVNEHIVASANTLTGQTGAWTATLAGALGNITITAAPGSIVPSSGSGGAFDFPPAFAGVQTITPAQLGALALNSSMISASPLPVGVPLSAVADPIVAAVNPVLANLNSTVMGPLYNALGIGFGSADVSPTWYDGKTVPKCIAGTTSTPAPTTTLAPGPTTTIAGTTTYSGVPVLVD